MREETDREDDRHTENECKLKMNSDEYERKSSDKHSEKGRKREREGRREKEGMREGGRVREREKVRV